MLRYALRRVFWTVPVMLGVTLLLFAVLSMVPSPPGQEAADDAKGISEPLPIFLNLRPRDVRQLSADAVTRLSGGHHDATAAEVLVRLGGAALPFVLPRLDSLEPADRERVAMALAPVAQRMGLATSDSFRTGADAVTFWTLFWQERALDFKPGVVRRAVRRLAVQGSEARRHELVELDTFVLAELMAALGDVQEPADVARVSRLLDVASHVTARDDRIGPDATPSAARACVVRWREWWLASRADYEILSGPSRVAAMLIETRYGHWALRTLTLKLGTSPRGMPVLDRLVRRAPRTLLLAALGLILAHAVGIPVGLLAAWRRAGWIDRTSTALALVCIALPLPLVVLTVARATGGRLLAAAAVIAIAIALVGTSQRHQRIASLDVWMRDTVRYARARGIAPSALLLRHALRPTVIAVVPLFALDFPLALSCACAAEKALGLRGIGVDIVRAVVDRDVSLLMAVGLGSTAIAALLHVGVDLTTVWLDPRTRPRVLRERA